MKWAYGVTTVPSRIEDTLPRTLESLEKAGFPNPRLFVDDCKDVRPYRHLFSPCEVTTHWPKVNIFGNWILSLWEIYLRNPHADRYAIFQDDIVLYQNTRQYLERCYYPEKGYWNLYTWPQNQKIAPGKGWFKSNGRGLGALGLVFNRDCVVALLESGHMARRPQNKKKGWKAVDGGIVDSLRKVGIGEFVHNPTLIQHTGKNSTIPNKRGEYGNQPLAPGFLGEDYNAMDLLNVKDPAMVGKPTILNRGQKIGLVGYASRGGLGEINRQIATHVGIDSWMVIPHRVFPPIKVPSNISRREYQIRFIPQFIQSIDTLLFVETPYNQNFVTYAKRYNKRIVCVPMLEWTPPAGQAWTKDVDLFICPTRISYNTLSKEGLPCIYRPWPIAVDRFNLRNISKVEQFLFIRGNGGWKGRKGASVIERLKQIRPHYHIVEPSGAESNADLYGKGDVLLYPHSVDGLGLELMEAAACGMPAIPCIGEPWDEFPAIARINSKHRTQRVKRDMKWYTPDPEDLAALCDVIIGTDISSKSLQVRHWAEDRGWNNYKEVIRDAIMLGRGNS